MKLMRTIQRNLKKRTPLQQNNHGFTLVWVALAFLVLLIFIGGVLTIAVGYHGRSVNNNAQQQAYFTARSVVNAMAQDICGTQEHQLLEKVKNGKIATLSIDALPPEMGGCTARLKRDGSVVFVEATATMGSQTSTVAAKIEKSSGNPNLPRGFHMVILGSPAEEELLLDCFRTDAILYCLPGSSQVSLLNSDRDCFQLENDVYLQSPLEIWGAKEEAFIGGNLYSSSDINIHDVKLRMQGKNKELRTRLQGDFTLTNLQGLLNSDIIANKSIILSQQPENSAKPTPQLVVQGNLWASSITLNGVAAVQGNLQTPNTLIMNGQTAVNGNATASGFTLKDDAKLTGNAAVAGTLTLSANSQIVGNATAQTVNVGDNTVVTNAVTAQNLTVKKTGQIGNGATANTIAVINSGIIKGAVTADTITLKNKSQINGSIRANKLSIDSNQHTGAITGDVVVETLILGNQTYTSSSPALEEALRPVINGRVTFAPVEAVPALTLTRPDAPPNLPLLPVLDPVTINRPEDKLEDYEGKGNKLELGEYDQKILPPKDNPAGETQLVPAADHYYRMTADQAPKNGKILIKGSGKIFLYLEEGVKMTIDQLTYQQYEDGPKDDRLAAGTAPNLFIRLEEGARLNIGGGRQDDFYCYLDARQKATVNLYSGNKGNNRKHASIYGGLHTAFYNTDLDSRLTSVFYIDPQAGESSDSGADSWIMTQYLPKIPDSEVAGQ